jgi:hypothetical protein
MIFLNIFPQLILFVVCIFLIFFLFAGISDFNTAKNYINKTNYNYLTIHEFTLIINMIPLGIGSLKRFNQYLKFLDPITKILAEKLLGNAMEHPDDLKEAVRGADKFFKDFNDNLPNLFVLTKKQEIIEILHFIEGDYFTCLTSFFDQPFTIYNGVFGIRFYSLKNPLSSKELQSISLILDDENNIKLILSSKHYKEKIFQKYISPIEPNFLKEVYNSKGFGIGAVSKLKQIILKERQIQKENIGNMIDKDKDISEEKGIALKLVILYERLQLNSLLNSYT